MVYCHNSFSADTTVETPEGDVPISEIEIGDIVIGYDTASGEAGEYTVTDTISHEDEAKAFVTIDGEQIETTPWHLFLTNDGWVEAIDLQPNDVIVSLDGYGLVDSVVIENTTDTMYDLTVDRVHNFAVGEGDWVVHNTNPFGCANYADYWDSGLHWSLQDAIVMSIRQTDPSMIIAVRSRGVGADYFDFSGSGIENKPAGAHNHELARGWKGDCGLRVCDGNGIGTTTYLSDMDVAFAISNGRNVDDWNFVDMQGGYNNGLPRPGARPTSSESLPGNVVNAWYGTNVVMHGTAYNGIINNADGAHLGLIENERLFVFNANGWMPEYSTMNGLQALQQLSPSAYNNLIGG